MRTDPPPAERPPDERPADERAAEDAAPDIPREGDGLENLGTLNLCVVVDRLGPMARAAEEGARTDEEDVSPEKFLRNWLRIPPCEPRETGAMFPREVARDDAADASVRLG